MSEQEKRPQTGEKPKNEKKSLFSHWPREKRMRCTHRVSH